MSKPLPISTNFKLPKQSDQVNLDSKKTRESFEEFIANNPQGRFSKVISEAEMYKICKEMLDNWDLSKYDELKAKHYKEDSGTPKNKLKYLDLFSWIAGRMNSAILMGLHKSMPLDILDIGTGPGHFAFIAKFFGHNILTSDIAPGTPEGSIKNGEIKQKESKDVFYKDHINFFNLESITHRVEPFKSASNIEKKFDLITILMPSFEKFSRDKELWGLKEWEFLIDDYKNNLLNENGRMFLWLSRTPQFEGIQPNDEKFISFMESKGATVDIGRSIFMFGEF